MNDAEKFAVFSRAIEELTLKVQELEEGANAAGERISALTLLLHACYQLHPQRDEVLALADRIAAQASVQPQVLLGNQGMLQGAMRHLALWTRQQMPQEEPPKKPPNHDGSTRVAY